MEFQFMIVSAPTWRMAMASVVLVCQVVQQQRGKVLAVSPVRYQVKEWVATISYRGCSPDTITDYAKQLGAEHMLSIGG